MWEEKRRKYTYLIFMKNVFTPNTLLLIDVTAIVSGLRITFGCSVMCDWFYIYVGTIYYEYRPLLEMGCWCIHLLLICMGFSSINSLIIHTGCSIRSTMDFLDLFSPFLVYRLSSLFISYLSAQRINVKSPEWQINFLNIPNGPGNMDLLSILDT